MRLSTLGLAVVLAVSTTAFAAEPLQLLFQDRPPYYTSNTDGTKGGLVSGPVEKALTRAGIPFTWVHSSGKGQIETVRRGGEVVCTPGWFKKPEREEFAKFSDPVYRDRPQVVIARTDSRDVFGHRTLAARFADKQLRFGAKTGYSYGPFADDLIQAKKPPMVRTTQDVGGLVRMLLGGRFDYILGARGIREPGRSSGHRRRGHRRHRDDRHPARQQALPDVFEGRRRRDHRQVQRSAGCRPSGDARPIIHVVFYACAASGSALERPVGTLGRSFMGRTRRGACGA